MIKIARGYYLKLSACYDLAITLMSTGSFTQSVKLADAILEVDLSDNFAMEIKIMA